MTQSEKPTFYFPTTERAKYLKPHDFYVKEARDRLLVQFKYIGKEADKIKDKFLESHHPITPKTDESAELQNQAEEEAMWHWIALDDMRNTTTLALIAAMFHRFDKGLREKTIQEFYALKPGSAMDSFIWNLSLSRLMELLEWVGIESHGKDYYDKIMTCQMVVNVYKHGNGYAHNKLSESYPEYYPYGKASINPFGTVYHSDLKVNESHFFEFANAISDFWKSIPEYCACSKMKSEPDWFNSTYKKHEKSAGK